MGNNCCTFKRVLSVLFSQCKILYKLQNKKKGEKIPTCVKFIWNQWNEQKNVEASERSEEKNFIKIIYFLWYWKKKQKQRLKQNLDALLYIEATTTHKEVSNISKSR